jgi:hypothetical protein
VLLLDADVVVVADPPGAVAGGARQRQQVQVLAAVVALVEREQFVQRGQRGRLAGAGGVVARP